MASYQNARNNFLLAQEQRRFLFASLGTLGALGLLLLGLWILDGLLPRELGEAAGTMKIRLGLPSAPDLPVQEEQVEAVQAPEPVVPEPVPEKEVTPSPRETPKPKEVEPVPVPAVVPKPAPPTTSVVKGQENGSSHETVFAAPGAELGRSFFVPVADYLPLPLTLGSEVSARIRKDPEALAFLERYYKGTGSEPFTIKSRVDPGLRPKIWAALLEKGYDPKKVEYRQPPAKLGPITIKFTIEASIAGAAPRLSGIKLGSSSGNAEVDEAVLYGFQSSGFYNNTDRAMQGTFTYRFD